MVIDNQLWAWLMDEPCYLCIARLAFNRVPVAPYPSADLVSWKKRILEALNKLGFQPCTETVLEWKQLRHEIGQEEETDQTRTIQEMENE